MEGFTLALALVDAIPVLSFGISMVIIASRFNSPPFLMGASLSVLAGCCKVAWKLVLGIKGKETTPFLLAKVVELTGGDSLESNIQLVLNNARLAARTAKAFCE